MLVGITLGAIACSVTEIFPSQPDLQVLEEEAAEINPAGGGHLSLSDGAELRIPPLSLTKPVVASIKRVSVNEASGGSFDLGAPVGARYEISVGEAVLSSPILLEIPYDPQMLTGLAEAHQIFLATYVDDASGWEYAGGNVYEDLEVVSILIEHASVWSPHTWNWDAWIAVLSKSLRGSFVELFEAFALLTDDCPQEGETVVVDSRRSNNVVQGCVEVDDPLTPELRIVNPKSIFFEVEPYSGGAAYFDQTLLSPGESLQFRADRADSSPFVVRAVITERAGWYLVVHMIITMLPGFNQIGVQGATIACITERLSDVSHLASAVESLAVDHNGAAAAENIGRFYLDAGAVQRLITSADDCGYGPASTWSIEGIDKIGKSISTLISAFDYGANYFAGNQISEVEFEWTQLGGEDPGTDAIVQIDYNESVFLKYDPTRWESFTEPGADGWVNNHGEPVEALRNLTLTDCLIHDNQGMGVPSHWRGQDTRETVGNLGYRVEEWTDLNTSQIVLVVYQYPYGESGYGIRIEVKPGLDPGKCISDVEDVLILSELLLWERAPAIPGDEAARTDVVFFEPDGFSGNQEKGACWISSIATPREGAWRCMTQSSQIYDPCFSHNLDSESVICNPVPWENRKGFRMILTEPLPTFVEPVQSHPWYFELEDGTVCFFLSTGTSIFTQIDDWIPYGCDDGWVIIGVPNEGVVWTAEKARLSGDYSSVEESEVVSLLKVWR